MSKETFRLNDLQNSMILHSILRDMQKAKATTIGICTLGDQRSSCHSVASFAEKLAAEIARHDLRSRGHLLSVEQVAPRQDLSAMPSLASLSEHLSYSVIPWNDSISSSAIAKLSIEARRLKQWIGIDLGTCDQPWTEAIGRLCDLVYLWIPSNIAWSPRESVRRVNRLQKAGIHVHGSWIAA